MEYELLLPFYIMFTVVQVVTGVRGVVCSDYLCRCRRGAVAAGGVVIEIH